MVIKILKIYAFFVNSQLNSKFRVLIFVSTLIKALPIFFSKNNFEFSYNAADNTEFPKVSMINEQYCIYPSCTGTNSEIAIARRFNCSIDIVITKFSLPLFFPSLEKSFMVTEIQFSSASEFAVIC